MPASDTSISPVSRPAPSLAPKSADGFLKSIYRFFDSMARHSQGFFILLGLLFAIAAAIGFGISRKEAKLNAGRNALFSAQRSLETELKALAQVMKPPAAVATPPAEITKPGAKPAAPKKPAEANIDDIEFSPFDVDAKLPDSTKQFRSVIAQYAGTRIGLDAELALGQLYYEHGQAEKANDLFSKAADDASGSLEKSLAFSALGYSQESAGKYSDAAQTFEKALNLGEGSLKGDLLMGIARCQEGMKDTAKARGTYDRIIQQLPNTEYAKNAALYKSLLE